MYITISSHKLKHKDTSHCERAVRIHPLSYSIQATDWDISRCWLLYVTTQVQLLIGERITPVLHRVSLLLLWCCGPFLGHNLFSFLPPTFSLPCCHLPIPYIEQICVIPQNSIVFSTSYAFTFGQPYSSETSSYYFLQVTRVIHLYYVASPL